MWQSVHKFFLLNLMNLTVLLASHPVLATEEVGEQVIVSGTIEALACAEACGVCCPTHNIIDRSGTISLQVGNSFVDLSSISDDEKTHRFAGYLYQGAGQCGIKECTFFAVESIDQEFIAAPSYDTPNETLVIESISSSDAPEESFTVTLSLPFNLQNLINQDDKTMVLQGEDCFSP